MRWVALPSELGQRPCCVHTLCTVVVPQVCHAAVTRWLQDHVRCQGGSVSGGALGGQESVHVSVQVVHQELPLQLCPLGKSCFLLTIDGAEPLLESDLPSLRQAAQGRAGPEAAPLETLDDVPFSALSSQQQRVLEIGRAHV